jgi:hypothetical protein
MRGEDERSGSLFSYVDLDARVDKDHPLRTIRTGRERCAGNASKRRTLGCRGARGEGSSARALLSWPVQNPTLSAVGWKMGAR